MQSMLLFSCFFASPSKNFAYFLGCPNEKKMVASCGFVGGVCTFLGAQIGKMFSNYIAMAGFMHFFGYPNKKEDGLQLYIYDMVSTFP